MKRIHVGPGTFDADNVFAYHPPTPEQVGKYEALRAAAKEFALLVDEHCPSSSERSTALAKIREAVMWANASIACNDKD